MTPQKDEPIMPVVAEIQPDAVIEFKSSKERKQFFKQALDTNYLGCDNDKCATVYWVMQGRIIKTVIKKA